MPQNPMQMMQQIKSFMNSYQGNPKDEAMRLIQQSGMNQQQLNQLQNQATSIYKMGQQMGFFK